MRSKSEIAESADDLRAILGASRIVRIYLRGGLSDCTTDSCLAIIAILYAVAWIALLDEGDHQSSGKLLIARAGEVIWRWPRWGNDSGARGDHNRAPRA